MPGGARSQNDARSLSQKVLVVQYGTSVDHVVTRLCSVDGMMRDILLYGQDMRTAKGSGGSAGRGGSDGSGLQLAIPDGLAVHVPYLPLDTKTTHKVLKDPAASDVDAAITEMRPTVVVLHGGLAGGSAAEVDGLAPGTEVLARLPAGVMDQREDIIKAMKQVGTKVIYVDAKDAKKFAQRARAVTGACVVAWMADEAPLVFNAYHFLYVFMNSLVDLPGRIDPEAAFALASELCCAFCTQLEGGSDVPPTLPHLLSDKFPALPGLGEDDALDDELTDAMMSKFDNVKLCVANAELRLLVSGVSAHLTTSARLGSLCQGIRGIVAAQVLSSILTNVEAVQIEPPYLPETYMAFRCSMKTESGITFDVVMGGPKVSAFNNHRELLEVAVRQVLIADAHSIQLKVPPAGAPLPPYHCTSQVGDGAPTIEVLLSGSTWVVYLLKRLTEMSQTPSLVMAGVAAASTSITSAFSKRDALRHVATVCNGNFQRFDAPRETVTAEMLVGALPDQAQNTDGAITPAETPGRPSALAVSDEQMIDA